MSKEPVTANSHSDSASWAVGVLDHPENYTREQYLKALYIASLVKNRKAQEAWYHPEEGDSRARIIDANGRDITDSVRMRS